MKTICATRRCGLCRFHIIFGEETVAGKLCIALCTHKSDKLGLVRRSDIDISQPFICRSFVPRDGSLGIRYVICPYEHKICNGTEPRVGCHVHCIENTPLHRLSRALELSALEFDFLNDYDCFRIPWLKSRLSRILETATRHLPYLPEELLQIIADYTVVDYTIHHLLATEYVNEICAEGKPGMSSVKTSEKIYARHVNFEGVQYLAYLTNEASDDRDMLLFDPILPTTIDTLYIANDALGIRRLLFADSSQKCTVEKEVNVWWRKAKLRRLGGLVRCNSDVSIGLGCSDSRYAYLPDGLGPEVARPLGEKRTVAKTELESSPAFTWANSS
ncbi:hypothetical protein CMUS01_15756 [Colletotrichum musicola]|uniref:Uncharacterized protein n=1 Tax=Colletotrichum musicola TaxID=2175873 RepID=A0A8H6MLV4_9PEZI|nr:hypothetical protein CMUS01_15756 [Colletotrichum musicola]